MAGQEFYIDYFDKDPDPRLPGKEPYPHFQLCQGNVGGNETWDQDDNTRSYCYPVISKPNDFLNLALEILKYLKDPTSIIGTYQVKFSEDASAKVGETQKQVLEEILALHNDFVTPKRRSVSPPKD